MLSRNLFFSKLKKSWILLREDPTNKKYILIYRKNTIQIITPGCNIKNTENVVFMNIFRFSKINLSSSDFV